VIRFGNGRQAFTAIGFGAKTAETGWVNESGRWENPALVEILKNPGERERFCADPTVQRYIQEQRLLDEYIFQLVKAHRPDVTALTCVQSRSGSLNKSKVLAYMYQHGETEVMNVVRSVAQSQGRNPIACIHDAIFFKRRLGVDLKSEIELQMREATGNPYWHLTPKELDRYEMQSNDAQHEEYLHRERMQHIVRNLGFYQLIDELPLSDNSINFDHRAGLVT
jgi:hypothetical protein